MRWSGRARILDSCAAPGYRHKSYDESLPPRLRHRLRCRHAEHQGRAPCRVGRGDRDPERPACGQLSGRRMGGAGPARLDRGDRNRPARARRRGARTDLAYRRLGAGRRRRAARRRSAAPPRGGDLDGPARRRRVARGRGAPRFGCHLRGHRPQLRRRPFRPEDALASRPAGGAPAPSRRAGDAGDRMAQRPSRPGPRQCLLVDALRRDGARLVGADARRLRDRRRPAAADRRGDRGDRSSRCRRCRPTRSRHRPAG